MRLIGHLTDEGSATTFRDFLYVQGIASSVEAEQEGWAVWIHAEDELPKAREFLSAFRNNPQDPRYFKKARQAKVLKEQHERKLEETSQRQFDRRRLFERFPVSPLTLGLILVSTVVTLLFSLGLANRFILALLISNYSQGAPEILSGQVWRLVTPIFIHEPLFSSLQSLGFLHLVFNMMWLADLGTTIERRQGPRFFGLLILIIAALSNYAQYYMSGPRFFGMSGVVYGLLGYVWLKGKFDPDSGYFLHSQTVSMMLIWYFMCLFGVMPHIANTVHTVGLVTGLAWGYLSSRRAA